MSCCAVQDVGTAVDQEASNLPVHGRASRWLFFSVSTLLFVVSTVGTIVWCSSMSCCAIDMPGGWTMSMMYLLMPGQTWIGAAAEFLGMWIVMMVAMMLPSLIPMLWRYRAAIGAVAEPRLGLLTTVVVMGYFLAWAGFGVIAFLLGVAVSAVVMEVPAMARAVPLAMGVVVLSAGLLQFTAWKARHLACCRSNARCGEVVSADARSAWRHGLRLGLHCGHCCFGLTAILLVIGAMDLWAMAVVTAAITAERLAPAGERVAWTIGVVIVTTGFFLIARAVVPG